MRTHISILILATGACIAPAGAITTNDFVFTPAAQACQLSLPTIDTKVSPRATGFRNDGTAGTFVICGLWKPVADNYISATIYLGNAASTILDVTCTGVNGDASGSQQYVSKTIGAWPASGASISFDPGDFGGSSDIPGGYNFSITCALPPHTSIERVRSVILRDIGT
jgi:hypothetical protein